MPLNVVLQNISKKYNRSWIFKDISWEFISGGSYAILGGNGSGKSTLMQIISGSQSPSRGKVWYERDENKVLPDNFFRDIAMAAPYIELPEELTLLEMLQFHAKFKNPQIPVHEMMELAGLAKEHNKEIRNFSSGMRQRLKLALALFFESELVLLDEPATHLDKNGVAWYQQIVQEYSKGKLLIISSNQPDEYFFCQEHLNVEEFKS